MSEAKLYVSNQQNGITTTLQCSAADSKCNMDMNGFLINRPRLGVMHGVQSPFVKPLLEADSSNDTPEFETDRFVLGTKVN